MRPAHWPLQAHIYKREKGPHSRVYTQTMCSEAFMHALL